MSFNGNKTITTGGGGAILLPNKKKYLKAIKLVSTAKENHPYEYNYKFLGYNYRLPSINASLGISQLKNINKTIKKKEIILNFIEKSLKK